MGPRMRRRHTWLWLLRATKGPAYSMMKHVRRMEGLLMWDNYIRREYPRRVADWEIT